MSMSDNRRVASASVTAGDGQPQPLPVFPSGSAFRPPIYDKGLGNEARVRWSVVSMYGAYKQKPIPEPVAERISQRKGEPRRNVEPLSTDVDGAKEALDRITMPEAVQRISSVLLPGSSVIISDEGLSIETGKDTDFVVVMSGEPQGALKIRQRQPMPSDGWGGGYSNSPFGGGFFKW